MVPTDAVPDATASPPAPPPATFSSFLLAVNGGELHGELTEAYQEAVRSAQERGKAATVTLTLRFQPTATGLFEVFDDVKLKTPAARRRPSVFFPDEDGALHRSDPRQMRMPFREVPPARRELRDAPITTTVPPAEAGA